MCDIYRFDLLRSPNARFFLTGIAMSTRNKILKPLGLALILTLGFGIFIGAIAFWCIAIGGGFNTPSDVFEFLQILADGTPAIVQRERHSVTSSYRSLDGKELMKADILDGNELVNANYHQSLDGGELAGPVDLESVRFPLDAENRIQPFSDNLPSPTIWYFIHDGKLDGKGYFMGFDSRSKSCVGYLGRQGACSDVPPAENWFSMDGRKMSANRMWVRPGFFPGFRRDYITTIYDIDSFYSRGFKNVAMISGDELLQINFQNRLITTLLKSSNMVSVARFPTAAAFQNKPKSDEKSKYFLAVRTSVSVILFDAEGKRIQTFVIPEDLRGELFTFYVIGDEKALVLRERRHPNCKVGEQLTWIDVSGKVLRQEEVTLLGRDLHPFSKAYGWETAFAVPAPVAMLFIMVAGPMSYIDLKVETNYSSAFVRFLPNIWPQLLVVCILGTILAWFCYRRQRRMALPWTCVWVGFVFLFGVPGFLGYLFHRRWPVLEKCHVCEHAVPHDREKCSSCGSEFPVPTQKGIEVFA
jgi:hypothetical protein